jgi:hypothetical protein
MSATYCYHLNIAPVREASAARFRSSRLHVCLTKNARTVDVTASGTVGRLAQQPAHPPPTDIGP